MVSKVCSRSQGQPPGARNLAIIDLTRSNFAPVVMKVMLSLRRFPQKFTSSGVKKPDAISIEKQRQERTAKRTGRSQTPAICLHPDAGLSGCHGLGQFFPDACIAE